MDSLSKLMKSIRPVGKSNADMNLLYAAYAIFGLATVYIFYRGQIATVGLAIGVALIIYSLTNGMLSVALIAGALSGLIAVHYSRKRVEGFYGEGEDEFEAEAEEGEEESDESEEAEYSMNEGFENPEEEEEDNVYEGFENPEEEEEEEFADVKKPAPKKKAKKALPPDHGSRAEAFQLGKKYKMPAEEDDAEFHLDAGSTFLNAYKSLKPDQVASMTKDTQDLMQTQKQLMSTLQTLKPLIKDGKEMMEMFQGYFGSGQASIN
jgi:hypothetical protein